MEAKKTRSIRWAVVGLGNAAQAAVPSFQQAKNAKLVALVSSDHDKLHRLGSRFGVEATGTYDELERIIDDAAVDAVFVAVPSSLHREMTERAARAGANVLCEKPMATTSEDCEAMIEACDDAGVKLMVAYRLHFEAANLEAIEPRVFAAVLTHAEHGGGALVDMGIYCVNAARHVFQAEPLSVLAMQTANAEERFRHVDETTSVIMRFPDDRIAQFTVSRGASFVSELRVIGTNGDVELGARTDGLVSAIAHLSSCIARGTTPEPSGEEGLADVRVIEAIIRSAATREVVHVEGAPRSSRPSFDPRRIPALDARRHV
jgi:predicted dehydrogenase